MSKEEEQVIDGGNLRNSCAFDMRLFTSSDYHLIMTVGRTYLCMLCIFERTCCVNYLLFYADEYANIL